jgi:hypothetical protein
MFKPKKITRILSAVVVIAMTVAMAASVSAVGPFYTGQNVKGTTAWQGAWQTLGATPATSNSVDSFVQANRDTSVNPTSRTVETYAALLNYSINTSKYSNPNVLPQGNYYLESQKIAGQIVQRALIVVDAQNGYTLLPWFTSLGFSGSTNGSNRIETTRNITAFAEFYATYNGYSFALYPAVVNW